jgi:hypothetical protein
MSLLDIDIKSISSFSSFSFDSISMNPLDRNIGIYPITVSVRDQVTYKLLGQSLKFNIEVTHSIKPIKPLCNLGPTIDFCLPSVKDISNEGLMTLKFPLGISVLNETEYGKVANAMDIRLVFSKEDEQDD